MANYLIIAGTSRIGQSVAQDLLNSGNTVFITGRNKEKTEKIAHELGNIQYEILDATDFDAVNLCFVKVKSLCGELHGVINCAGSFLLKPAHLTTREEFDLNINASLTSAFAVVRAAGAHMLNGGSVVLISSAVAKIGLASHEAMAAAKAGVIGLMMSAAASYAHQNLRFNAVAPGLVETDISKIVTSNPLTLEASKKMHPLGRIGTPEEAARLITFLLAEENSWITGQAISIDGGISTIQPKVKI
ncbi:SDR family oxidoreductase [Holosporaceae bacterium 'Namur']|nr:SDR family oxidoreductase [Holosporaceae bacterium 'Namur']